MDAGMSDWANPDVKKQFLHDLDDAVTNMPSKAKRKAKPRGKREENQKTERRSKDFLAVKRALEQPLSPTVQKASATGSNPSETLQKLQADDINYDDAPEMPIVNKNTGEKLL